MKKLLMKYVFTTLLLGLLISVNTKETKAMSRTEVYLEVGESYSIDISTKKPVLDNYGDEDKKVTSATFNKDKTKLTMKALAQGNATFYICKNGQKKTDNRVRTIKVHVYPESTNLTPSLKNNISHAVNDKNNYTNQPVYLYNGYSCGITVVTANCPTNVSSDTSGKAKAVAASSIYECNSDGSSITNDNLHFSPTGISGLYRPFYSANCKGSKTPVTTYIRGMAVWYSSTGKEHYTKFKIITVKIYPKPYITVTDQNGTAVSTANMTIGSPMKLYVSLAGMQDNESVSDKECVVQDEAKLEIDEENGYWLATPIGNTWNVPVKATFKYSIKNELTQRNYDGYTTFSKVVTFSIGSLKPTNITGATCGKNSIRVTWEKNNEAARYKLYRADTPNGDYDDIAETGDTFFVDDDVEVGKTYYYRVTCIGSDGDAESSMSEYRSVKFVKTTTGGTGNKVTTRSKKIKKPKFTISASKGSLKIKIKKKAGKYNASGFQIKVKRGKRTIINPTKWKKTSFKLKNVQKGKKYTIYIRTYKGKKKSAWVKKTKKA